MTAFNKPHFTERGSEYMQQAITAGHVYGDESLTHKCDQFFEKKYGWVDIGSSFLPSDIIAAFLYAQLEELENIQAVRKSIWQRYRNALLPLQENGHLRIMDDESNAHMFYLLCKSENERVDLTAYLKERKIAALFHFLPLHLSEYYSSHHAVSELPRAVQYSDCLLRLPLYPSLKPEEQDYIVKSIFEFYQRG